jgi:hypothetical protein
MLTSIPKIKRNFSFSEKEYEFVSTYAKIPNLKSAFESIDYV